MPLTLVTDDFNRASLGANWAGGYTSFDTPVISGSTVIVPVTNSTETAAVWATDIQDQAHWAQVTLSTWTTTTATILAVGLILRATAPATATWYLAYARWSSGGGDTTRISRYNAGTETQLATEALTTWAATDTLTAEIHGPTLRCYRNGSLLLQVDDATLTGARIGVYLFIATPGALTDISADNFSAGFTRYRPKV